MMMFAAVAAQARQWTADEVIDVMTRVNDQWQQAHLKHGRSFWDNAVYHTGNMEAYRLTRNYRWKDYSVAWAEHNQWKGAKSDNREEWMYNYGEDDKHVLFGDYQICFQTYIDIYNDEAAVVGQEPKDYMVARAKEVMDYETSTPKVDYWWWADALYMVMPVMTRMYRLTGEQKYLNRLYDYWQYANSLMYDDETGLYFRDAKYVWPKHKSQNGKKDFWARGDGWVLAALAITLRDSPQNAPHRDVFLSYYKRLARAVADCQQPEGYWTRSMLDPEHAPGPESSGTSLFVFGLQCGINNGLLSREEYQPVVDRAWEYLTTVALQPDNTVGYMQPIGEKAIPGQVVNQTSVTNFGTGAFLLGASEYARRAEGISTVSTEGAWCWFADPRALHYENASGTINASYIGYIDVHGNVRATQVDFLTGRRDEVLVRSFFQPDDHNNPTFLVLPDERVMIFYTRHTDERRIWYRISTCPGDITSLGQERYIETDHNTTYPSPFILSDDPQHIYLCWRGIKWHPTIARLTLPDQDDRVNVDFGPRQIVQSTGARPYAKYQSNGRDKIYLTYTTGHPDNEWPCWLYFNVIDINHGQGPILKDVKGNVLADISEQTFHVNKTADYKAKYPFSLVDSPDNARNWVWQIATDPKEQPVIALTRISEDKLSHKYLIAKWTGRKWQMTEVADGGHAFHQNWKRTEKCYSGGMAIDPDDPNVIYASLPTMPNGQVATGGIYEIWKVTMKPNGKVQARQQVTAHSAKNNVRPYMLPGSSQSPLRLSWMYGDYYYWMVKRQFPSGYPTAIRCDGQLPQQATGSVIFADDNYLGQTVQPTKDIMLGVTIDNYLYLRVGKQTHRSQCRYLTSDEWARFSGGTSSDSWPTRILSASITLTEEDGCLVLRRNGMVEIKVAKE